MSISSTITTSSFPAENSLETRLIDLESRIAFQERTLEILDEVVREFTQRIEVLQKEVFRLQALVHEEE